MSSPEPIVLVRGTELSGLPVVSISAGEALADVKDVVYSPDEGRLVGFTLNKRGGLFAGPLKAILPMTSVHAIGRDAVMVETGAALDSDARSDSRAQAHRNVLGNTVLTDGGDRLGDVTDLVVEIGVVGSVSGRAGTVVGYQLLGDPALQGRAGHQLFIPLPMALAISGTNLVVPASVEPFIRDDLSGFGGAVEDFRAQLGEQA